jgi:hypothetical protein
MTLHILHQLHEFYNDFTRKKPYILHADYILTCNYYVIQANYMKKSVPPIFGNGGYRLFHVISRQLLSFYTLEAEFYIQDVMNHVKVLIYVVIPCVLHRQCLPLHPGCNGHVKENLKNALHAIT